MVLIIAMALMNGFDHEFKKKLTIMNYPLTILPKFYGSVDENLYLKLQSDFPDLKFSPYVSSAVITKSGSDIEGGYLFGVNFEDEIHVNSVLKDAIGNTEFKKFDVIVGNALKEKFYLDENEKITYIFTQMEPGGMASTPKIKRFRMVGTFNSGLSAYDKAYSYTKLSSLQRVLHMPFNFYDGIHIYSDSPQDDILKIKEKLPDTVSIKGWWQDNTNFFAALELEKTSLFLVLMLIILIASVNIISSLLMTVMNRRSEIALLLSLGASGKEIKRVFLYLAMVIGVVGILAGMLLGLGGVWILSTFDLVALPKDVYPTATLPLKLELFDLFSILGGAFVIVLLSAWYPSKKASEVDILKVLRNE